MSFTQSRLGKLKTHLRHRMGVNELSSYEDYYRLLKKDENEFNALIEDIATKETYFFRIPGQFHAIREYLSPMIEKRLLDNSKIPPLQGDTNKFKKTPIRIWSIGCSTGEEACTIAMAIMEGIKYPHVHDVEILASDISRQALNKASTGFYEASSLKKIPACYKTRYMKMIGDGAVIADDLLRKISFRIFNLRNLDPIRDGTCLFTRLDGTVEKLAVFERFDIIFCRNVMIYFDFPSQQRLVDSLYECLKPGGYLFTGDAEILHIYKHGFENIRYKETNIYKKPETINFSGKGKEIWTIKSCLKP